MGTLTITRVGDDAVIVVPDDLLRKLNAETGGTLQYRETPNGVEITRRDAEVERQLKIAEEVMRDDYEVLRRLAG